MAAVLLTGCGQNTVGNGTAAVGGADMTAAAVASNAGSGVPATPVAANAVEPVAQAKPVADAATRAERSFEKQMNIMLVGRGTIDDKPITKVRVIDKCHTAFATASGETVIDWARAGNLAAHDVDGREINEVPGADGAHRLSVPLGEFPEPVFDAAKSTTGAFGQLALECGGLA